MQQLNIHVMILMLFVNRKEMEHHVVLIIIVSGIYGMVEGSKTLDLDVTISQYVVARLLY